MNDIDIINNFLTKTDISGTDLKLKEKCIEIKKQVDAANASLKQIRADFLKQEDEFRMLNKQFEVLLQIILEVAQGQVVHETKTILD